MAEANFSPIIVGFLKVDKFYLSQILLRKYTEIKSRLSEDVSTSNVNYIK